MRSNNVRCDMPFTTLDSTHSGKTLALHIIIAFGQLSWNDDLERGMQSWLLNSKHGQTTSGVACHHGPWATRKVRLHLSWQCHYLSLNARTVKLRWVWHAIIAHEKHRLSDDIGGGMLSSHINSTHYWMTSGMAWYRHLLTPHMIA